MQKFSKKEAIKFGWRTFKANWRLLVPAILIVYLVSAVIGIIGDVLRDVLPLVSLVLNLMGMILGLLLGIGFVKLSLNLVDGTKASINDLFILFTSYKLFFKFLAAYIFFGVIVLIGLVLFIVPGIIFAIKLMFYLYFIIDKNPGPIEALKHSWAITKGVKLNLFLLGLLVGGINLLGLLALVVGVLVTAPVTALAYTYVYRKLEASKTG